MRQVYTKLFPDFASGLEEIRKLAQPVDDTVKAAMNVSVALGHAVNMDEPMVVEYALFLRAGHANNPCQRTTQKHTIRNMELATISKAGFRYRTASECLFGWRRHYCGDFLFFIRLDNFKLAQHTAKIIHGLETVAWRKPERRVKDQELANLTNL